MCGRALPPTLLLLALAGWTWLPAETKSSRKPLVLESNVCYAVDVTSETTTIRLPDELDGHCDLILTSLATAEESFRVRISSRRQTSNEPNSLRIVPKFHATQRRPGRVDPSERLEQIATLANAPPRAPIATAHERSFDLHVTDEPLEASHGYVRIRAKVAAEGDRVRVYVDAQTFADEPTAGLIDEIVQLLDQRIIPRSRDFLGMHADVDGDGKLAVLLTPWLGKLQGGRTSVNGFVRSNDFSPFGTSPFSNRADVLYLNSAVKPGPDLAALLAHEYTHAICCSVRRFESNRPHGRPDEADWLNEAIAHVAEQMHEAGWSNLDRRVQSFLNAPERTPLVVRDYYRSGLWRDPGCRGATYLFLQWCIDTFGADLLSDLVRSPLTGIDNLETATGHDFAWLIRHWAIAVHEGALPSVNLHGSLGTCQLAGPARLECRDTGEPVDINLRGTATAFIRCLPANGADSTRCLVVEAPRTAKLLVTVARSNGARRVGTAP